jgi:GTP cyclohydrolase I
LLESFGEDLNREGLKHTPERVANFYKNVLSGNNVDPLKINHTCYTVKNCNGIILIKNISFYSICEHHLLPFFGFVDIAYVPNKNKVIGISKIVRFIEIFANRLQLQERFAKEIVDAMMQYIKPLGAMVIVNAEHLCMTMVNTKKSYTTKVVTSFSRGVFLKNKKICSEALLLLKI